MPNYLKFRLLYIISIFSLLLTTNCDRKTKERNIAGKQNTDNDFISFAIKTDAISRQKKEKLLVKWIV